MASIFDKVLTNGNSSTAIPANHDPGPESNPPATETLPETPGDIISGSTIESEAPPVTITAQPCNFAADRLKWSAIKGKFKKVDINPELRAWMMDDSRVYNWIWTSLAVITTNHDINDDFPLPRDLEIMIPVPDDFREMFGVEPGRCMIVTRKEKNVLSVSV
jgi:hypothetical protein